jgi:hypothetical protein
MRKRRREPSTEIRISKLLQLAPITLIIAYLQAAGIVAPIALDNRIGIEVRLTMKMTHLAAWIIGSLLIAGCRGKTGPEATLELIQKLGGSYKTDDRLADKPVVTVDLRDTPVADNQLEALRELPQLKILVLDGTKISDAGIDALTDCKGLERVFLRMTRVTPAGIERLKKAFPNADISN